MDSDRPSASRSGERPITRWRREPEPLEKPQVLTQRPSSGAGRPYSKMERPTSRRGIKNDITEYGISRPPTSGRNSVSRPPSANMLPSRAPTPTSRINTMSSVNLSRMNSGLPRNFPPPNNIMLDRPLTQQGLAGLRPNSSRGDPRVSRQNQDKRYYEQMLQLKIQELNQEIANVTQQIERHHTNKVAHPQYDLRSGELAAQLTDLQAQLAEYNMVLDKVTSDADREDIESELKHLKDLSNREEIERTPQKSKLEEKISPVKQEAYNLYVKIFEAEQKRNKFSEDDKNGLTSAEEKEHLLKKIRQDSLNAAAAERQIADLETNLDDSQLEKQMNHNENKKQEQIMDIFKSTIEKNKVEELEKFQYLQEQIIDHLEVISNNINGNLDSSILMADEVEILKTLMDQNFENTNEKSFEELKQDNIKLRQFLSKLQALELKIKHELNDFEEKAKLVEDQTVAIDNSKDLYEMMNKTEPKEDFNQFENRTVQRLEAIKRDYSKLKEEIEQNEIYRFISILEDKLERVMFENEQIKQTIEDKRKRRDHSSLMERLAFLTTQYNTFLINEMKTVY